MRISAPVVALAMLLALSTAAAAAVTSAAVTVAKTSSVVTDGVNLLNPRALPGSVVDYVLRVDNPWIGGLLAPQPPVRNVAIVDQIDERMMLKLDYGTPGSGPVEFTDGGLLGLLGSGLRYTYSASSVEYSTDGTRFGYVPVPVGGYDPKVRAIRVTLVPVTTGGTFTPSGSFRLRYRTAML